MKKLLFILLFLFITPFSFGEEEFRIVSLAPNTTEILFELGLEDNIIGVDAYSDYPKEAKSIKKVGTFLKPNIEELVLLKPTHIVLNTDLSPELLAYLKAHNIKIIKISPKSVNGLKSDIKQLGSIFNKNKEAQSMIKEIDDAITYAKKNSDQSKPKVFLQLFHDPLITGSSFIGDLIDISGGENIADDIKNDDGVFSYEALIERNPDIIILVGFSDISNLPKCINAVKNNRIYDNIDPNILLRPGARVSKVIRELNKIFCNRKNKMSSCGSTAE